jgi:hypothetical protein
MITFSCRQHKNRHVKANNCKARSIIYAKIPNQQNTTNIETQNNIENQINNNNNYNQINNNNIYINNYGNERLDYINFEKYLEIFKKCYDIPSALTKEIHFNIDFPENKNIKYNNEKTALIKNDSDYIHKDLHLLVDELIKNKTRLVQSFAYYNKNDICNNISAKIYEEIIELLFKLVIKEPIQEYREQVNKIMDLIRNNK